METIDIAGRTVPRLGFGCMRLTGPNIVGEPADRDQAVAVVRAAYDGGVRVFDTSWYYGPDTSSRIVREGLAADMREVLIVSKLGGARDDDGGWIVGSSSDQLRAGAERELRLLGLDTLPVVHLRWMPGGAADYPQMLETFQQLQSDGLIEHIGLSTVDVAQLDQAVAQGVEVATVSNAFGPGSRADDALLARCGELGIAFLPYFSLVTASQNKALDDVAAEIGATRTQVSIAWQLQHAPNVVPIPGTSKLDHLGENLAAADLTLTAEQVAAIG